MADIFLKIVNMSISACWIVLAILLLRIILKKAPKWINCVLWGIAGLRLVMPFSFESIFSLIPSAETITKVPDSPRPHIELGVSVIDNQVNGYLQGNYFEGVTRPMGDFIDVTTILAIVWIIGIVALLIYTLVSFLRLKSKIGTAVLLRDNIYQSEAVVSPFVLGINKPKIYLPFNITEQYMEHVIAHEQAHLRRKDHLWKPLGFLILTLHWFNPMVWIGYILLCRDIELACDEKVVKELNHEQRADYSEALLTCSVNRRMIAACPLAFGEVGVKNRVKSVLNYKKHTFWIIIVAIITSIAVAVCFLTNPKKNNSLNMNSQKSGSDLKGVTLEIVSSDLSAPDPFIEVEWVNNTSNELLFGEAFSIFYNENGEWENCSIDENTVWHLIGYLVEPNSTAKKTYKLNGQIMTQPGKYRFKASFNIDGQAEPQYKAWIEFELEEGVDGITVHTFKPVELVYDDGMYSFVQTADSAPTYMIVNSMQLLEKIDGKVSDPLGTFEEITLNKDNFDSRFKGNIDYSWLGNETLESLKDNNKRIWQLYGDANAETPRLYILLEQKDGTFYLGHGYYNVNSVSPVNPDDSHIRWLYKLNEVYSFEDIDEAVSKAIIDDNYPGYYSLGTECATEGHIIYGTDVDGNKHTVYAYTEFSFFGFMNGYFVEQSGGSYPAVLTFEKTSSGYKLLDIQYPQDGEGYAESINELFPKKYQYRVMHPTSWNYNNLWKQKVAYAQAYLDEIGRTEEICDYSQVEHTLFTDIGVSVEVSNKIVDYNLPYNYDVGYFESVEDGVRYIYRTTYEKKQNRIIYTKENYETKEIVEKIEIDSLTGEIITLASSPKEVKYNQTETDLIEKLYDKEEFVFTKNHYQNDDGLWVANDYVYKYRLEITGRLNNANKNTTYIVLSNRKDITFDETWKASGLSSNTADYFDPADAVIVGHKLFD